METQRLIHVESHPQGCLGILEISSHSQVTGKVVVIEWLLPQRFGAGEQCSPGLGCAIGVLVAAMSDS